MFIQEEYRGALPADMDYALSLPELRSEFASILPNAEAQACFRFCENTSDVLILSSGWSQGDKWYITVTAVKLSNLNDIKQRLLGDNCQPIKAWLESAASQLCAKTELWESFTMTIRFENATISLDRRRSSRPGPRPAIWPPPDLDGPSRLTMKSVFESAPNDTEPGDEQ